MPDNETDRSLVTFALFAYNQEKYIREAVKGAFSQTYEPLEIILSDDCSSDRTFEIMQEMASAYDGPHRVTCLKHKENLGVANHINKVAEVAKGEITVMAAGDDRSLPQRTAEHLAVYQLWPNTKAVYSNYSLAHHETPDIPTGEANSNIRINTLRNLISGGGASNTTRHWTTAPAPGRENQTRHRRQRHTHLDRCWLLCQTRKICNGTPWPILRLGTCRLHRARRTWIWYWWLGQWNTFYRPFCCPFYRGTHRFDKVYRHLDQPHLLMYRIYP